MSLDDRGNLVAVDPTSCDRCGKSLDEAAAETVTAAVRKRSWVLCRRCWVFIQFALDHGR